ncbi:MAG: transporter associated domain-containing protein [Amaricoccus sp.]
MSEDADPDSPARSNFFSRLFRRDAPEAEDEADAPESGAAAGQGARGVLVNLRNLRRIRVDDVAVPRAEIVAVSEHATLDEIVAVFQSSASSRLPVYAETLDQPVGLIHLKDLALKYGFGAQAGDFDLQGLLRPLLYAPPSMPIGVLLQKMQSARIHMALVIDEYGGVDGLVTIEDLLEQIVGDIEDEHDEDEGELWTREGPGVYLAQARMDLDDFEKAAGIRLVDPEHAEEVDTLGGLVIRLAGRLPAPGEVVMHPDGHEFEVVDADARRIKRLRARLKAAADAPAAAAE